MKSEQREKKRERGGVKSETSGLSGGGLCGVDMLCARMKMMLNEQVIRMYVMTDKQSVRKRKCK